MLGGLRKWLNLNNLHNDLQRVHFLNFNILKVALGNNDKEGCDWIRAKIPQN